MATEEMMVIGIAGGTGSGKTTLTNRLKERFGDEVTVIYHDNYYKRHDELTYEERCLLNYDHPDAFDTDLMMEHIRDLRAGKSIQCPVYDFTVHNRSDKTVEIHPTKVLVIEGILIFENKELRDPDGHQSVCRHRCRCAYPQTYPAGCKGKRQKSGICGRPVFADRKAHA